MNLKEQQENKRRTGRTQRMIQEALELANYGRQVTIIINNPETLQTHLQHPKITCKPSIPPNHNWQDTHTLIDHAIIETNPKFQQMHNHMTKYDQPHTPKMAHAKPIPPNTRYSTISDNFYNTTTHKGMGTQFYLKWKNRKHEFPKLYNINDHNGNTITQTTANNPHQAIHNHFPTPPPNWTATEADWAIT